MTKNISFRKQQLKSLINGHREYKDKIAEAMYKDIGWNQFLTDMFSNNITEAEMIHSLENIDTWAKK